MKEQEIKKTLIVILVCVFIASTAMIGIVNNATGNPAWPKPYPIPEYPMPPPPSPPTPPPEYPGLPALAYPFHHGWNLWALNYDVQIKASYLPNHTYWWYGIKLPSWMPNITMVTDQTAGLTYNIALNNTDFWLTPARTYWVYNAYDYRLNDPVTEYQPMHYSWVCMPLTGTYNLQFNTVLQTGWNFVSPYGCDASYDTQLHTPSTMASGLGKHIRYHDPSDNKWKPIPSNILWSVYDFDSNTQSYDKTYINGIGGDFNIGYYGRGNDTDTQGLIINIPSNCPTGDMGLRWQWYLNWQ